uniref:Structural maintenance of chromosome 1 protein n=1 Tax=Rhizophora mucronata TaxID=61149 RepID=A0A2P2JXR4_RHIMU
MMWSSIENLKQNLDRFALDVHGDAEELEIYGSPPNGQASSISDRRYSHSFAHSKSFSPSPLANGIDSHFNSEIEHYKAEIKRLQESEAEIKALAVNYSALLNEKEDHISRLNQENGSLKQNLVITKEALNMSKNENTRASAHMGSVLKGNVDQSPKRQPKSSATQVKNRYGGNQTQNGVFSKQDGIGNGVAHTFQLDTRNLDSQGKEKELADLLEEKKRSLATLQAAHELQLKQLKMELEQEYDKLANMQLKLQEEHRLNESLQKDLQMVKVEENKTSVEMSKLRTELDAKTSEIRQLQMELSRMEDEDSDNIVKGLRRIIEALEKENTDLKMSRSELEATLETSRKSMTDRTSPDGKVDSFRNAHIKEELELSLQKMERDLKETQREKDKALQQLARLKQHLLDKVAPLPLLCCGGWGIIAFS